MLGRGSRRGGRKEVDGGPSVFGFSVAVCISEDMRM